MLKLEQLFFSYTPEKAVLQNVSLVLAPGELLAVMGASGCGKSTLLNLIAGLLRPTAGILQNTFEKVAYVFQEPSLFPWLTVDQNIRAILPRKTEKNSATATVQEVLELVELSGEGSKYPSELSGGMKSRVTLARALAYGGDLMLLDEPFSALNEDLKARLIPRLRQRLKASNTAAILVTHQREDAVMFSDRILEW